MVLISPNLGLTLTLLQTTPPWAIRVVYYLSGTICAVIGWFSSPKYALTLWCAFQINSVSKRNNIDLNNVVFPVCTVSYGTMSIRTWVMN